MLQGGDHGIGHPTKDKMAVRIGMNVPSEFSYKGTDLRDEQDRSGRNNEDIMIDKSHAYSRRQLL